MTEIQQYLDSIIQQTDNACRQMINDLKQKNQSEVNSFMLGKISQAEQELAVRKQQYINSFNLEVARIQKDFSDLPKMVERATRSTKNRFETQMHSLVSIHELLIKNLKQLMK